MTKVGAFAFLGTGTAAENQERAKVCIEREQYSLDAYGRATFKEGVETIERVMEEDMEQIREVIIPEGAKTIAESAFGADGDYEGGCVNLASISLPTSLEEVGSIAFYM